MGMFERFTIWLAAVFMSALMVGCGGGGGSPGGSGKPLSLGGVSAITVLPGESKRLSISGGVPPYRAVSAETGIAFAMVEGSSLIIGGVAAGASSNVTVSDYSGATLNVTVTVGSSAPLYTTAPADLTLGVGPSEARTFLVAGGVRPYTITGNQELVARVTDVGNGQWRIEGVALGTMVVRIRDAAGKELTVNVTVGSPDLRVSSESISVPVGVPATVVLSGGQKPYRVAGGIPSAVQIKRLSESEFELTGLLVTSSGGVDVVFMDAAGKTVKTNVSISPGNAQFTISPSAISIPEASGTSLKFLVKTGARGNLTVLSSHPQLVAVSNIVSPQFNGDGTLKEFGSFVATVGAASCVNASTPVEITVIDANGSIGTAIVTILDRGDVCGETPGNIQFGIQAPQSLRLAVGTSQSFGITGGVLPLVAVSSDPAVVTAQIVGAGRTLQITGVAAGSAEVSVFDATGNRGGTLSITVVGAAAMPALAVLPNAATGSVGDQLRFIVQGGAAPYTLTLNNPSVASLSTTTVAADGGTFTATLLNVGSTVVTIRDAQGATATLSLNVTSTTPGLRVSPSELSLAERTVATDLDIGLNIYGGVGPYRVFSSDTTLLVVGDGTTFGNNTSVAGPTFIVRQLGNQDRLQDVPVVITVIDATGATATSQVTIKNNN